MTTLILGTFRLNGRLLAAGDRLVAEVGLTSARWQVLGAVALAREPLTVAAIARKMGLSRQAVQRLANELNEEGFLRYTDNPEHKRAKLVSLTAQGVTAYDAAMARYAPWVNQLASALDRDALRIASTVVQTLNAAIDESIPTFDADTSQENSRIRNGGNV